MIDLDDSIKTLKVLYVEDSPDVKEATLLLLQEFFQNIITASNGEEGLRLYKQEKPDLIITDINMPVMSGIEMIKEIRRENKDIPIIVTSAHSETEFFLESIKLGVDGYILKPIDLKQFLNTLSRVLQKIKIKKELDETLEILKQYQKAIDEFFIVSKTDPKGIITYVNKKFEDISKYKENELIGKPHNIVRHPDNTKELFKELWETIKDKKEIWRGVIKNRAKDGTTYYVDTVIMPISDESGNIKEFISVRSDITKILNPKKRLLDFLKEDKNILLAIFHIENFKDLENLYDLSQIEDIEDKFLKIFLDTLPFECKANEIFHLGDGEIVVAKKINDKDNIEESINRAKDFQNKLYERSIEIFDFEPEIIVSIAYGKDAYKVARYALSKSIELNTDFIIANEFLDEMQKEAQNNIEILKKIKYAVNNNGFVAFFQPIIDNQTKEIVKYESLVRLKEPDGNFLSPFFFLNIIKRTKYYPFLTRTIIEQAFKALEILNKPISISVNLSLLDIEKKHIRESIYEILFENKDKANHITFEIVEDENIKDFSVVSDFIREVKYLGIEIAIDDFGSGYSNFEKLLDYHPDILKIDGSLIKNIEESKYSLDIVETIVSFAKKQNLKTVAEFVENENIYQILKDLGVDYSQGWYFGKPQPIEEIIKNE